MQDVKQKVAFITGAASGMGLGMARAFSAAGARVMLADIEDGALARAVDELKALGRDVDGITVDVTNRDAMLAAAQATVDRFGAVHILCNNAGVGASGRTEATSVKNWRWTVDVNMWGVVYGLQAFLPLIDAHGESGHVVNTASMAGLFCWPELGAYNASKYAVVAITETLMAERRDSNIGVSVLCPGVVATNLATSARNRPAEYGGATDSRSEEMVEMLARGIDPNVVGQEVLEAILANQPYIFTDPGMRRYVDERFERIRAGYEWADNCEALRQVGPQADVTL